MAYETLRFISPAEVLREARRSGKLRPRTSTQGRPRNDQRPAKPGPGPSPWLEWFAGRGIDIEGGVDLGLVGYDRAIVAAGALVAGCHALGIRRDEMPRLQFFNPRYGRSDGLKLDWPGADNTPLDEMPRGQFQWSPDGRGRVLLQTGMSYWQTAKTAVHEAAHARQQRDHGGDDLRLCTRCTSHDHERPAHLAGDSFASFLERCYDIYDCKLHEPRVLQWAKQTLKGARMPSWEAGVLWGER